MHLIVASLISFFFIFVGAGFLSVVFLDPAKLDGWFSFFLFYFFGVFPLWVGLVILYQIIFNRDGMEVHFSNEHSKVFLILNLILLFPLFVMAVLVPKGLFKGTFAVKSWEDLLAVLFLAVFILTGAYFIKLMYKAFIDAIKNK